MGFPTVSAELRTQFSGVGKQVPVLMLDYQHKDSSALSSNNTR